MSFYNFRNIPVSINNNTFIISDAELSQNVSLISPYKNDEVVSNRYLPNSNFGGTLRIKYYLTGQDFLKNYLYAQENQQLTGNVAGITFNQGYISNYSLSCSPNSPVEVSANIEFFDKLAGTFATSAPRNLTGTILNLYNVSIDNLSTYTTNVLNNISQINFNYNCEITPTYEATDTGASPTQATRINIGERSITTDIISDNTNMDLPLSGENFGINLTFTNPYNNNINESFGCSGKINTKSLSIQSNNIHSHQIKIEQKHVNNFGNIGNVIVTPLLNIFSVYSEAGYHSFTSVDNSLNYINKIYVGDTLCPDYSYSDAFGSNFLIVNVPPNVVDDVLTIKTTRGDLVWPNVLNFTYSGIGISGLSMYSGYAGTVINISGDNFYRISDVYFGSARAIFKTVSPTLIQSIVPVNGTTNNIIVNSSRRNISGISTGVFFCRPTITTVTPVTGVWKDTLTIGGTNFSGVTGVKFNNVNAYSYTILSNSIISARTPETGGGFPSGYVTVLGSGGWAQSIPRYNPQVPIYSYDPISGIYYDKINIRTKIDTDYLFPFSGGYKVRFGNVDTVFCPSGILSYNANYNLSPYSTGNRTTGIMDIYSNLPFVVNLSGLINGLYDNLSWISAGTSLINKYILFDFKNPIIVQEAKWYQDMVATHGENTTGSWKFYGSNNNSTWTELTNIFKLGNSTTTTINGLNNNTNSYRYYNLSGVATGLTNGSPWTKEIEFKIATNTTIQNDTGCLTGQIPLNAIDDYIYLYQPDGTTTYTPNSLKFNVIGEPTIQSIAPSLVRQYQFFNPVLDGSNFKFFNQRPFYFALSGGINNNVQFYSNVNSNSGGAADTLWVNNVIITGSTGFYSIIVNNAAGSYTFRSGLIVQSGLNQARFGIGCIASSNAQQVHNFEPRNAIDGSTNTFASIECVTAASGRYLQLVPKNSNVIDISLIQIIMSGLPVREGKFPTSSGAIALYYRNVSQPTFYSTIADISGAVIVNALNGAYTGIKTIRVYTPPNVDGNHYMGINEINIY